MRYGLSSRIFASACAALTLLTGCVAEDGGVRRSPAPSVAVMKAETRRVMVRTELSGRIGAFMKAEVRPQVDGIILDRLFEEGALVRKGERLYRIDPASYQAAYRSAKGALAKARAKVPAARARADRYGRLVSIDAVSRLEAEEAGAEYGQALAEVEVCRAAVRKAEVDLERTEMRAPIEGRIGRSAVTVGALVTAGQAAPLAVIQRTDPVYVDVTRSSLQLLDLRGRLEAGRMTGAGAARTEVTLTLENGRVYPLKGELRFTDVSVDESTGMVALRAVFPNPDLTLMPGMYARVTVNEGFDDAALPVPQRAVMRDPKGQASVFVVRDGVAERRGVVTAERAGRCWVVSSGLEPGETVVVEGFQRLRDGSKVAVRGTRSVDEFLGGGE